MTEAPYTGRVLGGRYQLGAQLGAGGWGVVYEAQQTDLGRRVAVKLLRQEAVLSSEGLARFEREARAAAALGHPNIVQVIDFQARPGELPFIVMEMLAGETLGKLIARERTVSPARVARIGQQILLALDVAHRAGIVHRDVKPDNVFLVAAPGLTDFVKLLDFGVAKLIDEGAPRITALGESVGSPAFMAPEQITGNVVDARTDLYAVGATLYEALTGRTPYDATSLHQLLLAITEHPHTPIAARGAPVDPALASIVDRALAKNPAHRFATAAEMRDALAAWSNREIRPPSGPPPVIQSAHAASVNVAQRPPLAPPPMYLQTGPSPYAMTGPSAPPPIPVVSAPPVAPERRSGAGVALLLGVIATLLGVLVLVAAGVGLLIYRGQPSAAAPPVVEAGVVVVTPTTSAPATSAPAGAMVAPGPVPGPAATTTPANGGPSPRPAPGTPNAVDAGAPSRSLDAGGAAPLARKQMAGARAYFSGGTLVVDTTLVRPAIEGAMPAINRCYAATEFEPPDHQFMGWSLDVTPAGMVTNVRPLTNDARCAKLDACMNAALRTIHYPPGATSSPSLMFSARTRDNP